MIKTLLYWVWVVLFFSLSLFMVFIPSRIMYLLGLESLRLRYIHIMQSFYGKSLFFMGGGRLRVKGLERIPKKRNLCIIANHQAYADIMVMVGVMPFTMAFIAKKELGDIPILSQWMYEMGCLLIDRKNMRSGIEVILKGIEKIKSGTPVLVFPEGTRSKGGKMAEFKKGSLKLATKSKAIIIPVTLDGTYKFYEETGQIKSCKVYVTIHDPIETEFLTPEEEETLHEKVHSVISQSLRAEVNY